ncbi:MAG: long-chain fatty acid--CoA ligase [Armatimonadetes bacterium]|nr:long-chain fatty acid--CoA ligase [Armatimonadota bacterium]
MSHISDSQSLGDLLRRSVKRFSGRQALMVPEEKGFRRVSFDELYDEAYRYAGALRAAGAEKGERLCIVGETCVQWALVDWAAQTLGVVTVPIYPTLPADQAQYIASDSGANLIIVGDGTQAAKFQGLDGVKVVGWSDGAGVPSLFDQDATLTRVEWEKGIDAVERHELATLIYTSGTTGPPKGVMLSHDNFISICADIPVALPVDETDVFLVFLPLSHVFARLAGHVLPTAIGATIAYAGSVASIASDMVEVRPTIMFVVPRFLESVRARIIAGVKKQSPMKQRLFNMALAQGLKKQRGEFAPLGGLLDKLVGEKIRARTGGKLKFFVSGGAALSPHVSEFYIAFGLTVLQGYGLTETTAASCLNSPDDNRPETVGKPLGCVEFKIAEDGEILQRGASVMLGYYNLSEASKEAIGADGWFHTGDIGELDAGSLKITDRKKDLLVLGNGKNVAPLHVESTIKESDFIEEAVLFGDGMEYCCALIVPEFDRIKTWLKEKGESEGDNAKIVERDDVKALIKSEIKTANSKLADYERAKKHVLLSKPFTLETGELTPSLKVKRRVVKEMYANELQSMKR